MTEADPAASSGLTTRVQVVLALVWAGLAAGMLVSWPAWAGHRVFPSMPVADIWKPWPAPWDAVLAAAVLVLIGAGALLPARRGMLVAGFSGLLLLVLQDQVRWQPWVFQYLVMLGLAAVAGHGRQEALLAGWRLFLIGTYFWGGFHKLGPGFSNLYQSAFVAPLEGQWPAGLLNLLRWQGPFIPWIEMAAAMALVFSRTRKAGVVLAAGTHGVILLLLGPWGTQTNTVVLPWNAIMIPLVAVLFWQQRSAGWKELRVPGFRMAAAAVGILLTLTPLLGRTGRWDRYASFQLYSGTDLRLFLVMDQAAVRVLPQEYHAFLRPSPADSAFQELRFVEWSLKELGVPVPAEERLFLRLAKKFAVMEVARQGRSFFYVDYPFLLKERGWDTHTPAAVATMSTIPPFRKTVPAF